jgi:hypothetical protein
MGKMKDEMKGSMLPILTQTINKMLAGLMIDEFCGLRSKMYSLKYSGGKEKKTAKGVSKAVRNKVLRHSHYVSCLKDMSRRSDVMRRFASSGHVIHTIEQIKVTLCCFDDKRFIISPEGFDTLAHGHVDTLNR